MPTTFPITLTHKKSNKLYALSEYFTIPYIYFCVSYDEYEFAEKKESPA
jgi:hypothetical protein